MKYPHGTKEKIFFYKGSQWARITKINTIQNTYGTIIFFLIDDKTIQEGILELLHHKGIPGLSAMGNQYYPHVRMNTAFIENEVRNLLDILKEHNYVAADFARDIYQYFFPTSTRVSTPSLPVCEDFHKINHRIPPTELSVKTSVFTDVVSSTGTPLADLYATILSFSIKLTDFVKNKPRFHSITEKFLKEYIQYLNIIEHGNDVSQKIVKSIIYKLDFFRKDTDFHEVDFSAIIDDINNGGGKHKSILAHDDYCLINEISNVNQSISLPIKPSSFFFSKPMITGMTLDESKCLVRGINAAPKIDAVKPRVIVMNPILTLLEAEENCRENDYKQTLSNPLFLSLSSDVKELIKSRRIEARLLIKKSGVSLEQIAQLSPKGLTTLLDSTGILEYLIQKGILIEEIVKLGEDKLILLFKRAATLYAILKFIPFSDLETIDVEKIRIITTCPIINVEKKLIELGLLLTHIDDTAEDKIFKPFPWQ